MTRREKVGFGSLAVVIALALICCPITNVGAEDVTAFPSKPISLIVPWPPGGGADLSCRKIAELASKVLKQPILILNKAGGAGVIGTAALASAQPDGYTIGLLTSTTMVITPHMRQVPFDSTKDFTYVMQIAEMAMPLCIRQDARWNTLKEYIEDARKNPGKLTYSTAGPLSVANMFMEQIAAEAGVKITHVPVQGDSELLPQLLGGHIDAGLSNAFSSHLASGKLRALAITGDNSNKDFPDVPTFLELGYKAEMNNFFGLGAPKNVDPLIIKKIKDAFKKAWDDPSFKKFEPTVGHTPVFRDSQEFAQMALKEFAEKGRVLKAFGAVK
jgi:tripartite-type tricarboxylate transporter receptor subunit TctC